MRFDLSKGPSELDFIRINSYGCDFSEKRPPIIHEAPKYHFTKFGAGSTDTITEDQIDGLSVSRLFDDEATYSLRIMNSDYSKSICEIFFSERDLHDLIMRAELARVR